MYQQTRPDRKSCLTRQLQLMLNFVLAAPLYACGGGDSGGSAPPAESADNQFTLVTESAQGGKVIPQSATLAAGGQTTLTITPDIGYVLDSISGCNGSLSGSSYLINNLLADCKVLVTFRNVQSAPQKLAFSLDSSGANVTWSKVEHAQGYKVYYAEETFSGLTDLPQDVQINQVTETTLRLPLKKSYNNYFVRVSAIFGNEEKISQEQLLLSQNYLPRGNLNDTAITYCLNKQLVTDDCNADFGTRQDGNTGRDKSFGLGQQKKIGTGTAGFDFTKVNLRGEVLDIQHANWKAGGNEATGETWSCVRDNTTGLIWEIKQSNGAMSPDSTFTWYHSKSEVNDGEAGSAGNAACGLSQCNTEAYVAYLNKIKYCGSSHWRLPTRAELSNILMNAGGTHKLDPLVFPDTFSDTSYWTSSGYQPANAHAWAVAINTGILFWQPKNSYLSVRLVHSR